MTSIPLVDLRAQYQAIASDVNAAMARVFDQSDFILGQELAAFEGEFANYCGVQHAKMLLRVSVDTPEDFAAWVQTQQKAAVQDDRVAAGRRIFETTACINCHAIGGTVANGQFGPDLTHLMSRQTIASGAAPNTTKNLRLWIDKPDAIKPGSLMPAMKLSNSDLDALVSYMETLR